MWPWLQPLRRGTAGNCRAARCGKWGDHTWRRSRKTTIIQMLLVICLKGSLININIYKYPRSVVSSCGQTGYDTVCRTPDLPLSSDEWFTLTIYWYIAALISILIRIYWVTVFLFSIKCTLLSTIRVLYWWYNMKLIKFITHSRLRSYLSYTRKSSLSPSRVSHTSSWKGPCW